MFDDYYCWQGNGFIKHQIRRTNGLLLQVGKGRWPASVVADVLSGKCEEEIEWPSIPAYGLCLMKVTYPDFPALHREEGGESGFGGNRYEEN